MRIPNNSYKYGLQWVLSLNFSSKSFIVFKELNTSYQKFNKNIALFNGLISDNNDSEFKFSSQ